MPAVGRDRLSMAIDRSASLAVWTARRSSVYVSSTYNPISPGESGVGRLSFDVAVSDTVRALLRVGSTFDLAEGHTVVATAEVKGICP
jgi:hypothetical protein